MTEGGDTTKSAEAYSAAKLKKLADEDFQEILSQETMRSVNIRRRAREMRDALMGA